MYMYIYACCVLGSSKEKSVKEINILNILTQV